MFLDFDQIKRTSLNQSRSLVTQWLNGKQQGTEFVAYNPTRHDNRLGSFKINLETGQWADFASNDKGGDLISLYAYLNHLEYAKAAQELTQQLGLRVERPDPPQKHSRLGKPSQIWKYTEEFYVYRFQTKNGGKEFRPVSWNEDKWHWRDPKGQLPLYHLDQLQAEPQKGVVICEGEKAADAAQRFFPYHITTTTAHGSQSPKRSDFRPLKNRAVLIWPDNDDVGQKYAQMVAQLALAVGAQSVHLLQIPKHLPPKWDAADANGEDLSGWQWSEFTSQSTPTDNNNPQPKYHLTSLGNAERFAFQHQDSVRYCFTWNRWLKWNSRYWEVDETGHIQRLAKQTVRSIYAEATAEDDEARRRALAKHALASESRKNLGDMIELAKSEEGIPVTAAQLDTYTHLLNVQNGTIDLRNGKLSPHRREHLLTHCLDIPYDENASCPQWERFLQRIMNGNQNLINFLQRAIGYSLTSETSEECLFFLHGDGQNGKSTFLETALMKLLGRYTRKLSIESLMFKKHSGIPNDIARLKGARAVVTSEAQQGRRLDETLIKDLTGGDTITARYMRSEWFDFQPEFKLWMSGNYKPVILGADEGIWRRINLIPFKVAIPEHERDNNLRHRLTLELPGILAWAVKGCLAWREQGLNPPSEVTNATTRYRREMDSIGTFLEECCVVTPEAKVAAKTLYEAYKDWCTQSGEHEVLSQKRLGERLTHRGLERRKSTGGYFWWYGLGLTDQNHTNNQWMIVDEVDDSGRSSVSKTEKIPSREVKADNGQLRSTPVHSLRKNILKTNNC